MKVILYLHQPTLKSLVYHYLRIHAHVTRNGPTRIKKCKSTIFIKEKGTSINCLNER